MINGALRIANVPALFKALLPQNLVRYALLLGLVFWGAAGLLEWITEWEKAQFIGALGAMQFAIFTIFVLPPQLVSLASSRPFSLLGNSRQLLFGVALVMSLLIAGSAVYFFSFMGSSYSPAVLWLMVSMLLLLAVRLCSLAPGIHGFIYFFNLLFADLAHWLDQFSAVKLVVITLILWSAFARWWFRWQPKKYHRNYFFMPFTEVQKQNAQHGASPYLVAGRAKSWLGSRLLGMPDGWMVRGKQAALIASILALIVLPGMVALHRLGNSWIEFVGFALFIIITAMISGTYACTLFNNLRLVWLMVPGNRSELLSLLWRRYWCEILPQAALLLALAILVDLVLKTNRGIEATILLIVSLLVFQVSVFWITGWLYLKWGEGQVMSLLFGVFVFPLWFLSVCATGLLFPLPFDLLVISPLWIILPEIMLIAFFYVVLPAKMRLVNFARAG